jgi:photosystem II stability/assembly factor-like uncharacterized protein
VTLRQFLSTLGRRPFGTSKLLAITLALGIGLAACHATPPSATQPISPVLGQTSASPSVEGQPAPNGTGQLGAVSCADASHCWAVGVGTPSADGSPSTVIVATDDAGLNWAAEPLPPTLTPDLTGIACPSRTLCLAVGSVGANPPIGEILATHNAGRSWQITSIPLGALAVISVSCADISDCTVLVSDGTIIWSAVTTDFGQTWDRQGNLPTGLDDARDLSCTAAGACLVAGNTPTSIGHGQGTVVVSTDDGVSWTAADVPAGTGLLQDAWCATATRCLAVGTTSDTVSDVVPAHGALLVSNDGGHTWFPSAAVQPVDNIFGVSCPSARDCVVVGTQWVNHTSVGIGGVATSENAGAQFTAARTVYTPLSLIAVTCPTASSCIAVGGDTVARIALPRKIVAVRRHRR